MSSQFGHSFRISTFGESHGGAVGVTVDGCPPRIEIGEADIQRDLDRRRPGQSEIVTPRDEEDRCRILSGVFEGRTIGTPIAVIVFNKDARPEAYREMESAFRPSHADYTYQAKYGIRNWQGGGRASARETIGRVAAAAIAKKVLAQFAPALEIVAYVKSIHDLTAEVNPETVTQAHAEANIVRCPDAPMAEKMIAFDKLEAALAGAMLSLPATKGFEIGSGFAGTRLKGSEHNDPFEMREGRVRTRANRSGGIQGGISNGEPIFFRVAFKPTATIFRPQDTVTTAGGSTILEARGRHDPCVLPRAVPMVEAMTALVLCDHALRQRGQCGSL
jgi:chorismate synthase